MQCKNGQRGGAQGQEGGFKCHLYTATDLTAKDGATQKPNTLEEKAKTQFWETP